MGKRKSTQGTGELFAGIQRSPRPSIRRSTNCEPERPTLENAATKLMRVASDIRQQDANEAGTIGFFGQLLVQVNIPHRDPGVEANEKGWGRRNGNLSFIIRPGAYLDEKKKMQTIGLPYGTYPRLITAWISSEVVRTQRRELELGYSFRDFERKLGVQHGSTTSRRLQSQVRKFFGATFSWSWTQAGEGKTPAMALGQQIHPIEGQNFFWDPRRPEQMGAWASTIVLNQTFFEQLRTNPVPVDLRVIHALAQTGSSLGIDIYCWLTHRFSYLKEKSPIISWDSLMDQMGTGHKSPHEFARDFKKELKKVHALYPKAHVETVYGGLRLVPANTHVRMLPAPTV